MPEISWPWVGLVLGVLVLLGFRPELKALLARTRKLGAGGIEAFDPTPSQVQLPATEVTRAPLDEFNRTFENPLLLRIEDAIRESVKERGFKECTRETEAALIRSLAGTQITLHFEQVSGGIWGSQVVLLQQLAARAEGMSEAECRSAYELGRANAPNAYENYTPEQWLSWLVSHHLVEHAGGRVTIGIAGREYLKWRIDGNRAWPVIP